MDKATKKERARIKAERTKRGELSHFEPRGLGRKAKSSTSFPTRRCSKIHGGTLIYLKRRRRDNTTYSIPLIIGGTPCNNVATVTKKGKPYCLGCLAGTAS